MPRCVRCPLSAINYVKLAEDRGCAGNLNCYRVLPEILQIDNLGYLTIHITVIYFL